MKKQIRVKAMCLIEHKGKLLLCNGYDSVKKEKFLRVIGGSIDFGEKAEDAVRREVEEELGSNLENLKFITVVEGIFVHEGEKKHEVIFLYKGDLTNKDIYNTNTVPILDHEEDWKNAEWIPISDILKDKVILYPSFDYKKLFSELNWG